jgi:hypothetical protein
MVEVIHLDSCVLRALLDAAEDMKRKSDAIHLVNSNRDHAFRVSMLAMGEVFGKLAETRSASECGDAAAGLSRLLRTEKVELYGIGKGEEAMEIAVTIMEGDPLISPADALLIGCALSDAECSAFITLDRMLGESRVLRKIASKHRVRVLLPEEIVSRKGSLIIDSRVFKCIDQLSHSIA